MLDLGNLKGTRVMKASKELFVELIEKQLTFKESMETIQLLQQTLATWGSNWLDDKYLNHIKQDLIDNGHKI